MTRSTATHAVAASPTGAIADESAPPSLRSRERTRTNDRDRTQANIIEVATAEFAQKGFSGARMDAIARQTQTSKPMIYYYFESKEGLYRAVLEDAYRRLRDAQAKLDLEGKPPLEALAQHVRFTFDFQRTNTDFVRLVMAENIHNGEHMAQFTAAQKDAMGAIQSLRGIVERGVASGVMRKDLEPIDLHMSISALCAFTVGHQHTFSTIFKVDMTSADAAAARRESVTEMILRFVAP